MKVTQPVRNTIVDVEAFLALKRIALVGASHDPRDLSRVILREMLARGYDVFPVNPRGGTFDGRLVATSLTALREPVDGALIMVPSEAAAAVVKECAALNIGHVWLHRGAGAGATHPEATRAAHEHGLALVDGECPLMFLGDGVHALHGGMRCLAGQFPRGGQRAPSLRVRVALVVLQCLIGVNALIAGLLMLIDPSGARLGVTPDLIAPSPFTSFVVPGLVLGGVIGVGHLAAARLVLKRRARAGQLALGLGVFLVLWVGVELLWLTETSWLQPVVAALGVVEIGLAVQWGRRLRPAARRPRAFVPVL